MKSTFSTFEYASLMRRLEEELLRQWDEASQREEAVEASPAPITETRSAADEAERVMREVAGASHPPARR